MRYFAILYLKNSFPKLIDIYVPMEKLSFTCTLKSDYTIQALLMETNHSIIESFGLGLGLESFMT